MKYYRYGMKSRPFGIGCQPNEGLVDVSIEDRFEANLWNVLTYKRKLSQSEIDKYELIDLNLKT